ncbi:MAG: hypothetical protein V4691_09485 [Pseudomonadota bacterium]
MSIRSEISLFDGSQSVPLLDGSANVRAAFANNLDANLSALPADAALLSKQKAQVGQGFWSGWLPQPGTPDSSASKWLSAFVKTKELKARYQGKNIDTARQEIMSGNPGWSYQADSTPPTMTSPDGIDFIFNVDDKNNISNVSASSSSSSSANISGANLPEEIRNLVGNGTPLAQAEYALSRAGYEKVLVGDSEFAYAKRNSDGTIGTLYSLATDESADKKVTGGSLSNAPVRYAGQDYDAVVKNFGNYEPIVSDTQNIQDDGIRRFREKGGTNEITIYTDVMSGKVKYVAQSVDAPALETTRSPSTVVAANDTAATAEQKLKDANYKQVLIDINDSGPVSGWMSPEGKTYSLNMADGKVVSFDEAANRLSGNYSDVALYLNSKSYRLIQNSNPPEFRKIGPSAKRIVLNTVAADGNSAAQVVSANEKAQTSKVERSRYLRL